MYIRFDKEIIEEIEKITKRNYETTESADGYYLILIENIEAALEDLLKEYNALKETTEAGDGHDEYDEWREFHAYHE